MPDLTIDLTAEQVPLVRSELLLMSPDKGGFCWEPETREEVVAALEEMRVFLAQLDALGWENEATSVALPVEKWSEIMQSLFTQAGEKMERHNDGDLAEAFGQAQLAASITERLPKPVEA